MNDFMTWLFSDGAWRIKWGIIGILVLWGLCLIFKWVVLDKPAWKYKDPKRAMKALDKLDELNYRQLLEIEEKSPLIDIQAAAREKNRLWHSVHQAFRSNRGARSFDPETESKSGMEIERGTLAVFTNVLGMISYLSDVTSCFPDELKPSSPGAAEYRLVLSHDEKTVGTYTDGSSAKQPVVTGRLSRGDGLKWERHVEGGMPQASKVWGSSPWGSTGTRAYPTPMVLQAIGTVRADNRSAGK